MSELVGAEVVARALTSLPADARETYESATSVGWVPLPAVDAMMAAVARESGWDPSRLSYETSRVSVERLLRGLWRVILRFTSDEALVARTPLIYSKTFDTGRLESRIPRPGHAEVVQSGWVDIPDVHLVGLAGGIDAALRAAGRANVRVTWKRTPTGAAFTATWAP